MARNASIVTDIDVERYCEGQKDRTAKARLSEKN